MESVVLTGKDRKIWDGYVMDSPASIAWQTYGWSDVVGSHYGLDFFPLAVVEGRHIRGILPLYLFKSITGKNALISVPYAVAGGMLADGPDAQSLLLEKAVDLSRRYGSCRIVLKQYKIRMQCDLRTDDNYYNRELPLTGGIDNIWDRISERNRERVSDSMKISAVLDYPSSGSSAFHKLLTHHLHNIGVPCVGEKWIEDLLASQMYSIALLRKGGAILAATMVKEFKDTVSFPFTCLAGNNDDVSLPAYALYWKLIGYFAARGKAIFHSGRIPVSGEAEPHRLGWGGAKYQYFYQYYPNSETKTEYLVKRGSKRNLIGQCWKRLPSPITGYLGPHVVKYFP